MLYSKLHTIQNVGTYIHCYFNFDEPIFLKLSLFPRTLHFRILWLEAKLIRSTTMHQFFSIKDKKNLIKYVGNGFHVNVFSYKYGSPLTRSLFFSLSPLKHVCLHFGTPRYSMIAHNSSL